MLSISSRDLCGGELLAACSLSSAPLTAHSTEGRHRQHQTLSFMDFMTGDDDMAHLDFTSLRHNNFGMQVS